MIRSPVALVNLAMAAQVGDNREMTATSLSFTSIGFLASVTIHVGLERTWASESLITDLALVLLLCA